MVDDVDQVRINVVFGYEFVFRVRGNGDEACHERDDFSALLSNSFDSLEFLRNQIVNRHDDRLFPGRRQPVVPVEMGSREMENVKISVREEIAEFSAVLDFAIGQEGG